MPVCLISNFWGYIYQMRESSVEECAILVWEFNELCARPFLRSTCFIYIVQVCISLYVHFLAHHFPLWIQRVTMGTMKSVTARDLIIFLSEKKDTLCEWSVFPHQQWVICLSAARRWAASLCCFLYIWLSLLLVKQDVFEWNVRWQDNKCLTPLLVLVILLR